MIKTVIFDMDGVLIDSIPVHFHAWQKLFSPYGRLTWEEFAPHIGVSTGDTVTIFRNMFNVKDDTTDFSKEKDKVYMELSDELKLYPQIPILLEKLKENGLKLVVATSEPTDIATKLLTRLNVSDYFETIVGRDVIQHPKPAPDLFLKAAELSESSQAESIVIEDSVSGITAGKKADMKVIAVTTTTKPELLKDADIVTDDLLKTLTELDYQNF